MSAPDNTPRDPYTGRPDPRRSRVDDVAIESEGVYSGPDMYVPPGDGPPRRSPVSWDPAPPSARYVGGPEPAGIDTDPLRPPAVDPGDLHDGQSAGVPAPPLSATATADLRVDTGADPARPEAPTRARTWTGVLEPFVVGKPGAAATNGRRRLDPDMPYRPDTVLDGAELLDGTGRAVACFRSASVRGLSHRHNAKTRQDDCAVRQTPDRRYLVAVVADGVSAGHHSHRAAALVSQRGSDLLVGWLAGTPASELPWSTVVQQLSEEVTTLGHRLWVRDRGTEPTDREILGTLATTALFAIVELVADGTLPVHLFAVGDSSAWILRGGTRWEPQQAVKNAGAEVASSSTDALPSTRRTNALPIRCDLDTTDVLVLVTDGVGDPLQDGDNDFGDYLRDQWATPPSLAAFVAQVDFARKSFDDDRTAVAVWPGAG